MGKIVVVKVGGNAVEGLPSSFFARIREFQASGYGVVIVHGGGPQIDSMLERLSIPVEKKNGLRVTSQEVLDIASTVLCGEMNKSVVTTFQKEGFQSVGLSGCDGHLLHAEAIDQESLGFVGELKDVNVSFLQALFLQKMVPIIAPIGLNSEYQLYNVNADNVAWKVAACLEAEKLFLLTDVCGIMEEGTLIPQADEDKIEALIESGVIKGGMIPKVNSALQAIRGGVDEVWITNNLDGSGTAIRIPKIELVKTGTEN